MSPIFATEVPETVRADGWYGSDGLAYSCFPKARRAQIQKTNPLERLNAEVKCRTDVVGMFPNLSAVKCAT
jgi:transposase-like protein